MTFVHASIPSMKGVPLSLEGDAKAVRVARQIARDLKAEAFSISKSKKSAYHAWGGFASPLLIALLVTGEKVAQAAGLTSADARRKMLPILRQTLANYAKLGPAAAFSGPIVRGDASVVRNHLKELERIAGAREVYLATGPGFASLSAVGWKEGIAESFEVVDILDLMDRMVLGRIESFDFVAASLCEATLRSG